MSGLRNTTLFLLIISAFFAECIAQRDLLARPLQLSISEGRVDSLLNHFAKESGLILAYSPDILEKERYIQFSGEEKTAGDHLLRILKNQSVLIRQRNGKILILPHRKETPPVFTVSGYIREEGSGESLIAATIRAGKRGTYTNEYGFFSLSLPAGEYDLEVNYIGYGNKLQHISLQRDLSLMLELASEFELDAVQIVAEEYEGPDRLGHDAIYPSQLTPLPVLLGQQDLLKQAQLLPGIQSSGEGVSGLVVRGGGPDQSLMLMDGAPIYNPSHTLGLFSVFYGDAVQYSNIIKGDFPAEHGGRLSSVVDVRTRDGNQEEFHGEISTNFLSGSFRLEGPIIKNKTSFHLSARRTYLDLLTRSIQIRLRDDVNLPFFVDYSFSDLNLKLNHTISPNSRLYLSAYRGRDVFDLGIYPGTDTAGNIYLPAEEAELDWGNQLYSIRWNRILGMKGFMNTTVYSSNYQYNFASAKGVGIIDPDFEDQFYESFYSRSQIRDIGGKFSLTYYLSPSHTLKTGAGIIRHRFAPALSFEIVEEDSLIDPFPDIPDEDKSFSTEVSHFVQDEWRPSPRVQIRAGIRTTVFWIDRGAFIILNHGFQLNGKQAKATLLALLPDKWCSLSICCQVRVLDYHLIFGCQVQLRSDLRKPGISTQVISGRLTKA